MPRIPSVIECPICSGRFKQCSNSRTKKTVCVKCGRMFYLWEARFFVYNNGDGMVDVTASVVKRLSIFKERHEERISQ